MTPAICWACKSMPVNTSGHNRSMSGLCKLCIILSGAQWTRLQLDHQRQLVQLHIGVKLKCHCGKGAASVMDGNCKFCREHLFSRRIGKSLGVKHAGDGLRLEKLLEYLRGQHEQKET